MTIWILVCLYADVRREIPLSHETALKVVDLMVKTDSSMSSPIMVRTRNKICRAEFGEIPDKAFFRFEKPRQ